jgi:hypothetical protein
LGGSNIHSLAKVHDSPKDTLGILIDEGEIALVKKASRAFAIGYVNEIYNTINHTDPKALKNITITNKYPFYLYVFIHQDEPGKINQLDIYSERKYHGDGLSEVKEIYHDFEYDSIFLRKKKRNLAKTCNHWRWSSLEIPKMYTMALSEGRRVGTSIYNRYVLSFNWLFPKSFVHQPNMNFPAHKTMGFQGPKL